ncbi:MAG: EAL domain-containing protein, partial [Oscillospiraceae bacterium]|nr:EAL domain-containing protein [Oscillospiraceae bacterium]
MFVSKHKSPINRSIIIGCTALITVLSIVLSLQTRMGISKALYKQYNARLLDVITNVEHQADIDDLRECIENARSSPKRDELQQSINIMVDDFELAYLYIGIMQRDGENVMISVVTATSSEERAAGEEDWPILLDATEYYSVEDLIPYGEAWNRPGEVSYFEENSDYGLCYTACKPLVDSNGDVVAMVCADYMVDSIRSSVKDNVARSTLLIVGVCIVFGVLLAFWLRKNVTKPIRELEQSALRFAKLSHEGGSASELSLDANGIEASGEVRLLIDAMTTLSREMTDQAKSAAVVKSYAKEMEAENRRLTEQASAAIKIAELTQSVTALLTNMPGMTSSKDVETGKYLACNQAFADFVNRRSPKDVIGLTDLDIFDKGTAEKFAADDKQALSMDQPYSFYEEVLDASGNPRQFQTTKLKFTDTAGRLCTLCMRLDYTELMRVKRETVEAKAAYEKAQTASAAYSNIAQALSANYTWLYYVDLRSEDYLEYNSHAAPGESPEMRGKNFFTDKKRQIIENAVSEDRAALDEVFTMKNMLRMLDGRTEFSVTYRRPSEEGEYAYVSMRVMRMQGDNKHIMVGIGDNKDIEERNELTDLHTEAALYVRGKELLQSHPEGWCVIALDLEHFKLFNEWYGRESGDGLLSQIGEQLARVETETGGLACYMGQDDFALLIPYNEEAVKRLYDSVHELVMEYGTSVGFMPAVGVCMAGSGKVSVEELFDRAAQASQHAKEDYHHRIRIFEESMYQKTEQDYQILSDFQQALKNHELFIQLQPQCEVKAGKVVGAESLVRWKKADGTMVSPGVFVPVLEQYGFVTDLDQFVWEEVCR